MQLTMERFKGVSETFDIRPLTVFTGPNGSGKSARLEALTYGLIGYTSNGKTLEATAAHGDNSGLAVGIELDGVTWRREIKRGFDGRCSERIDMSGQPGLKLADARARIAGKVGDFTVALNLDEFTALSPDQRRQFIAGLCAAGSSGSPADLLADLELAVLSEVLTDNTVAAFSWSTHQVGPGSLTPEQRANVVTKLWAAIHESVRSEWEKMRRLLSADVCPDMAATILAWVERAKALKSEHRKDRDSSQAAAQRLTADKGAIVVPAEAIPTLSARLVTRQDELASLDVKIGAARMANTIIDRLQASAAEADRRVSRAADALGQARAAAEQALDSAAIKTRLAEIGEIDLEQFKWVRDESRAALDGAQVLLSSAKQCSAVASADRNHTTSQVLAVRRDIDSCGCDPWARAKALVQPVREAYPGCEHVQALSDHIDGSAAETLQHLAGLRAHEAELVLQDCDLTRQMAQVDDEVKRLTQLVADEQSRLAAAEKAVADAENRDTEARDLRGRIESLSHAAEAMQRAEAELAEAVRAQQAAARALIEAPVGDADDVALERAEVASEIADLQAMIGRRERLAAIETELAGCIKRGHAAAAAYDLAGHVEAAVKVLRETMLGQQMKPLLSGMNQFIAQAGFVERWAYCSMTTERGRPEFDLGWTVANGEGQLNRSMDTLSGGEAALYCAGLAYALTMMRDAPLKVLTIEADCLDQENLGRLLCALAGTTGGGGLDYALVATCHEPTFDVPRGCDVVRLAAPLFAKGER